MITENEANELLRANKPVKLYYDSPNPAKPGEYLVSIIKDGTQVGTIYLVCKVTKSRRIRFRTYLLCIKCPDLFPVTVIKPSGVYVNGIISHPIFWYPRKRKSTH